VKGFSPDFPDGMAVSARRLRHFQARRVVAKVEWHAGELFPRVGFIVTNLKWHAKKVVRFYNRRGTADITHAHYTSSERWCGDPDSGYNPCVGVA
jgi:hypothetical protein